MSALPPRHPATTVREITGWSDGEVQFSQPVLATHLLDQDSHWRTRDGQWLRLDDMTPQHRANLLRWLRRNAATLLMKRDMYDLDGPMAVQGEMARLEIESILEDEWERDPLERLEETPLYQRLSGLVAHDASEVTR